MKTLLLTLATIGFTITTLKAQESATAKVNHVNFGVFAGLSYTNPLIDNQYIKAQVGFLAGVDVQYRITNQASLHLQPSWAQVVDARSQSNVNNLVLSTFKLPFLYRRYVFPGRKPFFAQAGLSYNYLTNSNMRRQWDFVCITAPCPNVGPDTPSSNKSAVSGIAGIGYIIELKKISVPITVQYERYFSNYEFSNRTIFNPSQIVGEPSRMKLESFVLTTGINF